MARARKPTGGRPSRGAVYDLEERRRRMEGDPQPDGDEPASEPDTPDPGHEETPEEREQRIADLKKRIAAGTYDPDPREIARKLLERGF